MIPTILVIIPALSSFVLNLILWFFMCHYVRKTSKSIHKSTSSARAQNNSRSNQQLSSADCQFKSTDHHVHSSACRSSNCELVRSTTNKIKTSYYLTIIMLNIIDLPYYCFHMYFVFEAIFKWKNFKYETSNPVTKKISGIFFVLFIVGHSINLLIYIMFHEEFRKTAWSLFSQVFQIVVFF